MTLPRGSVFSIHLDQPIDVRVSLK